MSTYSTALQTSAVINEAVQTLRDGGLVAFPTETVYGLGADARNPEAIQKLFTAKGRPSNHPVIVHLAAPEKYDAPQVDWAALLSPWVRDLSGEALQLINAFWPGPLTLVFKKDKSVLNEITGGQDIGFARRGGSVISGLIEIGGAGINPTFIRIQFCVIIQVTGNISNQSAFIVCQGNIA